MKDILHIEVWASKDNPIHVEWDYIYLHLIYEVVVDSKLESALLDHSQLHLLSDPTQYPKHKFLLYPPLTGGSRKSYIEEIPRGIWVVYSPVANRLIFCIRFYFWVRLSQPL